MAQSCPTLCDPVDCSFQGSSARGISRQEYWSGLPFASPGDIPDPRIEPESPALRADTLPSEPPGKPPESGETDHKARTGCFQEVLSIPTREETKGHKRILRLRERKTEIPKIL